MNLEKAIETNREILGRGSMIDDKDDNDAIKLGIEALKWRRLMELDYGSWCGPLLPGETEE